MAYPLMVIYLAVVYLQPGIRFPVLAPLRPALLTALLAFGASIFYMAQRRQFVLDGQLKIIAIIYAFMGAAVVVAYLKVVSFDVWLIFGKLLLAVFFAVQVVDTLPRLRRLLYAFAFLHLDIAVQGIRGFYTTGIREDAAGLEGALSGFLGDANDFALAAVLVVPYAYFLIPVTRRLLGKVALAGCVVLSSAAIAFTQSRGGFLALGIVFIYALARGRRKGLAVGIAAALLVVATVALPQSFWDRMGTIQNYEQDVNAQGRLWAWQAGFRMALSNPVFGLGPGNFVTGYRIGYRPEGSSDRRYFTAHSVYFEIMGELGFAGFGLFVWLLVSIYLTQRRIFQAADAAPRASPDLEFVRAACHAMRASLFGFLVGGAFLSAAYYPHIWFLAAFTQILAATSAATLRAAVEAPVAAVRPPSWGAAFRPAPAREG